MLSTQRLIMIFVLINILIGVGIGIYKNPTIYGDTTAQQALARDSIIKQQLEQLEKQKIYRDYIPKALRTITLQQLSQQQKENIEKTKKWITDTKRRQEIMEAVQNAYTSINRTRNSPYDTTYDKKEVFGQRYDERQLTAMRKEIEDGIRTGAIKTRDFGRLTRDTLKTINKEVERLKA